MNVYSSLILYNSEVWRNIKIIELNYFCNVFPFIIKTARAIYTSNQRPDHQTVHTFSDR